jgi:DNA-binding CsgD family transcriptional regulator/PAS domain-containing protein
MTYTASDPEELQSAFYEAAANPDMWSSTLGKFASAFRSRGCLLTTPDFTSGRIPHSSGMQDVLDQFFSENWHTRDLRTNLAISRNYMNGFFSDHDLLTSEAMEASDYYRGFAKSAGVPWFSAAVLTTDINENFVAISFQRSDADGAFERDELNRLNALLPQLRNAAVLARNLSTMRGVSFAEGLELANEGAILVDYQGKTLFLNTIALGLVGQAFNITGGRLSTFRASENASLARLIAKACSALWGATAVPDLAPVLLTCADETRRIIVRAAPIQRSGSDVLGFSGVVLMLTDLDRVSQIEASLARDLFGLTARETQIFNGLCRTSSLQSLAASLGISREAVRFHLKSIFQKTNTHRQSELVALVYRLDAHAKGLKTSLPA